jgi:hypothetical protein
LQIRNVDAAPAGSSVVVRPAQRSLHRHFAAELTLRVTCAPSN